MKIAIILLFPVSVMANDLSGLWQWNENSTKQTFSLTIIKNNNKYLGSYCAVGMSGSRIDCSNKNSNAFTFEPGKEFIFKTNYSNAKGKAIISNASNLLAWKIIEQPNGEHYAPNKASLIKRQTHNKAVKRDK